MAVRRMVHKTISHNRQVNSMSEFAQLLFTWIIPHLDDFGKIEGDPAVIKALVMPMNQKPIEEFEKAINEIIAKVNSVERYEVDSRLIIKYNSFEEHQTGLKKRTKSKYPDNPNSVQVSEKILENQINSNPTEENRSEINLTKKKIKKAKIIKNETLVQTPVRKEASYKDPSEFPINDERAEAAFTAWKTLEPDNERAFWTTYVRAYKRGLPAYLFGQFKSEIKQDPNIQNPGAVFNLKVEEYFQTKKTKR